MILLSPLIKGGLHNYIIGLGFHQVPRRNTGHPENRPLQRFTFQINRSLLRSLHTVVVHFRHLLRLIGQSKARQRAETPR